MKGTALQAALIVEKKATNQKSIITMTDVKGIITYVNDIFCIVSGYSKEELIGQNHRILNSGGQPKSYWQAMYKVVAGGNVWHDEVKNKAKDGHYYWVDTTMVPFLNAKGKVGSYIAIRTDVTHQKKMANTLYGHSFAMEQHSLIAITDDRGSITYANNKFCEISGYSEEELIGQNHRILNSGNKPESYWQAMYKALAQGNIWHDEVKNKAKDGRYYWVDTTVVPFIGLDGKPEKYLSIRSDITEQKELHDALVEQKFAMDQHSIVATTDAAGNITYANEKFCKVSQYSQSELLGQNHRFINSKNKQKPYWKEMYQTLARGKVWKDEFKNVAKDGSYYWVDTSIVPFMGAKGEPGSYISIRTDITQQKKIESILSSQRFAMDQHSITSMTDVTGTITYVNDKFCEVSGYSEEELMGQSHGLVNSGNQPKSYWTEMYKTVIDKGIWQDEVKDKAKDGSCYWVDTTIVPFFNSNGKVDSYISVRTDVTKYKQIQEKLEEQQGRLEQLVLKRTVELERANKELIKLSELDPLTKLRNKRKFEADFNLELKKSERVNRKMALYFIDLDRFKKVNDTFGHEVGDGLLQHVAQKMVQILRGNEYLYRVGGDEFCILVPEFDNVKDLQNIAIRLVNEVSSINNFGSHAIDIGCSIGVSIFPDNGKTLSDLIASADKAMYQVKHSGKGDYLFSW